MFLGYRLLLSFFRLPYCWLAVIFLFGLAYNQAILAATLQGQLKYFLPEKVANIPIVLLELAPDDASGPGVQFNQRGQTDESGNFSFSDLTVGARYQLGIQLDGERVGSPVIGLSSEKQQFDWMLEESLPQQAVPEITFSLSGQVTFPQEPYFALQEVYLIEHSLDQNNQLLTRQLAKVPVEPGKQFRFVNVKAQKNTAFKLAVPFQNLWLLSSLFGVKDGDSLVRDFALPALQKEDNQLLFDKNTLVLTPQEEQVKVSEFLNIYNPTNFLLDVGQAPARYQRQYSPDSIKINIPQVSQNIWYQEDDKLFLSGYFPSGERLSFYEWEFPNPWYTIEITVPLMPNVDTLEVLIPQQTLLLQPAAGIDMTQSTAQIQEESYDIYQLKLQNPTQSGNKMQFVISGFSIGSVLYWLIAAFIALVFVASAAVFVLRNKHKFRKLQQPSTTE